MKSAGNETSNEKPGLLRLWLFRCITVLGLPLLLLAAVEFCLVLLPFGYQAEFAVECGENGKTLCDNSRFSWLFFSPPLARAPSHFSILQAKPRDRYRIFVLGASAAMGDPEPSYGFSRMLEVMLQERYPEAEIEVVNTAMAAINSHVVVTIAEDVAALEPDLFIVYLGNNEVVGPYGAGTVFAPISPNRTLIRAGIKLKRTRTGQLFDRALAGRKGPAEAPVWRGMEMFLEQQVRFNDPGLASVYSHFRENLEAIIDVAMQSGAKIILSTVGTNLKDSAPFASLHRGDLADLSLAEWQRYFAEGIVLAEQGLHKQAIARFDAAAAIDGEYADLHFRLALSQLNLGEKEKAAASFSLARDYDVLRFRADTRINQIIRQVATERNEVLLLDSEGVFVESSTDNIPGEELFYEHVHMAPRGNYLIASHLLKSVENLLPKEILNKKASDRSLSIGETLERLAFSPFDQHRIEKDIFTRLKRPPFVNQLDSELRLNLLAEKLKKTKTSSGPENNEEVVNSYLSAMRQRPWDPWLYYNFGVFLEETGSEPGILVEYFQKVLDLLPSHVGALDKQASALIRLNRFEEALDLSNKSIELSPFNNRFAYHAKASALANLGYLDESLATYQVLLEREPAEAVDTYNRMGRLQLHRKDFESAVASFENAVAFNTSEGNADIPDILYHLGYSLKRAGKTQAAQKAFNRAILQYQDALKASGTPATIYRSMGTVYVESGNLTAAVDHFAIALRLEPNRLTNHYNLIKAYEAQGLMVQAVEAAEKSVELLKSIGMKDGELSVRQYLINMRQKIN